MTIDLRPGALDLSGYPGNAHTLTLAWPADALDGTTWTATIAGDPVDSVSVDGDSLAIEFTFPAAVGVYDLLLIQTDPTPDAVKAKGRVRSTQTPTKDLDSTNLTVTLSTAEGTVTVIGTGPSGEEGADGVSDGDKGDITVTGNGSVWTIDVDYATGPELDAEAATRAAADGALSDLIATEQTTRAAADTALDGRLDTIEALGPLATDAELAAEAALARNADNLTSGTVADARVASTIARDSEVTTAVAAAQAYAIQRANHTGTQPSTTISDFTEAVQDAVAALLGEGSNITLTYDDGAGSLTIDATGGGGGGSYTDEQVRDAIGVALVGAGLISVNANDALDTITITTTATANSTDAALRDRTTHTGSQTIATITGLQGALDAKQPLDSDLTAIAALTTTAYGRAFLALADAAAGRTALGLGTAATAASGDFQPVDADLTAIAALTTTAYGRSLLAAADAAALRTLAGVYSTGQVDTAISNATSGATLLTSIKTVDGTGSGLDADLLDGLNSTAFATAAQGTDTRTPTDNTVSTAKLVDDAVTNAKLANMAASRIKARKTASTGDPEDITLAELVALGGTPDGTKFLADDGTLKTPAGGGGGGAWSAISKTEVTTAVANVDLTSIPATYHSLVLVVTARSTAATTLQTIRAQFNGDTGSNYDSMRLIGQTNSAVGVQSMAAAQAELGLITGSSSPAGSASALTIDLPGYSGTVFRKAFTSRYSGPSSDGSGGQVSGLNNGEWRNTAAINRINLYPESGNFDVGTTVVLYGIAGA